MPAEPRLRCLTATKSGLNLRDGGLPGCGDGRAAARGGCEDVREQVGGALISLRGVGGERLEDDIVDDFRDPVVLYTRRGHKFAADQTLDVSWRWRGVRQFTGEH